MISFSAVKKNRHRWGPLELYLKLLLISNSELARAATQASNSCADRGLVVREEYEVRAPDTANRRLPGRYYRNTKENW